METSEEIWSAASVTGTSPPTSQLGLLSSLVPGSQQLAEHTAHTDPMMAQPKARDGSGTSPLCLSGPQVRPIGQEPHLPLLPPGLGQERYLISLTQAFSKLTCR